MNLDALHLALLAALFIVPKLLVRYRVPGAITCFALGAVAGMGGLGDEPGAIRLLATFGIVALFLLAGMEVEWDELRREARVVGSHVATRAVAMGVVAWVLHVLFDVEVRPALLISLGLLTPSTGFILSALRGYGLSDSERFWVRSKAIASELLALALLFGVMQSSSFGRAAAATGAMVALALVLPVIFKFFARKIVPHAPGSEFAFLIVLAMVAAEVTYALGAYYLVGAFVVGVAAERYRDELPQISSKRMQFAIEAFASVFIPFYFFKAGAHLDVASFGWGALAYGVGFLVVILPLRVALVVVQRRLTLGESFDASLRVAAPLLPTLVFTLVVSETVSEHYGVGLDLVGGLVVYTIVNTALPALLLRRPPPSFDAPEISPDAERHPAPGPQGTPAPTPA